MAFSDRQDAADGMPSSVFDMAELGSLFEEHWSRLVEIVRRRLDRSLGVRLDAEEIVNTAYLDARRRWAAYKADPKVTPFVWLYRIVNDRVIEEWRSATRLRRDVQRDVPWPDRPSADLGLRLVADDTSPTQAALREELVDQMRRALEGMSEPDREVIRLRGDENLSFAEIGELLEISENTATVRYVRALRRLKRAWQRLTGESRP